MIRKLMENIGDISKIFLILMIFSMKMSKSEIIDIFCECSENYLYDFFFMSLFLFFCLTWGGVSIFFFQFPILSICPLFFLCFLSCYGGERGGENRPNQPKTIKNCWMVIFFFLKRTKIPTVENFRKLINHFEESDNFGTSLFLKLL